MLPGLGALTRTSELSGQSNHPYAGFRFKVEISGITSGAFQSVSGLSIETEVVDFQEGGLNTRTHKLRGQTKYGNIVLKRGMTTDKNFYEWMSATVDAKDLKSQRKTGSIVVYDDDGSKVVMTWTFVDAWPCKFEGPGFDASSSSAIVETLELAHHGLTLS